MKIVKKIAFLVLTTVSTLPISGQDLLARQAPIDRKMKAVDSVALQHIIYTENYDSPAEDLYEDWSNKYAVSMSRYILATLSVQLSLVRFA